MTTKLARILWTTLLVAACGTPAPAPTQGPGGGGPGAGKVTLLDLSGKGIKDSAAFTATGPWTVAYAYDCSSFGQDGLFAIYVEDNAGVPVGVAANEVGMKGSSTSAVYSTGTLHLTMNSTCNWHVTATQP